MQIRLINIEMMSELKFKLPYKGDSCREIGQTVVSWQNIFDYTDSMLVFSGEKVNLDVSERF